MANVSHTRSVASTHPSHQGDQSAPSPRQSEAMRVRQARVRPSSQWRLGAIPLPFLGQAISRGLRAMSCCIRPHRGDPSAVAAEAFRTAASKKNPARKPNNVLVHAPKAADSKVSKPAYRTGFDNKSVLPTAQDKIAADMWLPTSFASVRDSKAETNPNLTKSALPQVLDIDTFREMSPAVLDNFLQYSVQNQSAENLLFLIASEQLLSLTGIERKLHAFRMEFAFTSESAPLAPNFSGKNKKAVQSLLNDLRHGHEREDLAQVLDQATRNLLESCGADAYSRWRQELPK